jgi:hypothetical protein
MAMKIKFFLVFLINFISLSVFPQNNDFGIWYSGNVSYEFLKNTEIGVEACLRTNMNASHIDQFFISSGVSYKFNKYVSLSGNYRWILKDEAYNLYFSRHRFYTDLKLSYPINNFKLSTRARFQTQYKQYADEAKDKLPDYYCRIKAQVFYNWPFSPINPYVSVEWFYPLNNYAVKYANQKRLAGGIEYKFNKRHSIDAEFIFQREYLPGVSDMGILSFSYNLEL